MSMSVRLTSPGSLAPYYNAAPNLPDPICSYSSTLMPYRSNAVQRNVKLSNVLECTIHKLYSELQKLMDVLPTRSVVEKKVDIALFLGRSRHMFVRLLALIKWANSAPKIDKCEKIMNQLNHQSMVLLDTANILSRMAKETLVSARLPPFAVVLATDILTQKTYTRLPSCIGRSIASSSKVKKWDQLEAICNTNRLIEYRLSSITLPQHMCDVLIENGRAVFTVPNEFQISLTLMSDVLDFPWRILGIRILVRDPVVGRANPLLHPSQVQYLQDQLQARILFRNVEKKSPLQQIYEMLHYFCLNLQLDVLYEQAQLMVKQQPDAFHMEPYQIGCPLAVRYWHARTFFNESYAVYVSINHLEKRSRLQIHHSPQLSARDINQLSSAIENCSPSFDLLLHKAICISSRELLKKLKSILLRYSAGPVYLDRDSLSMALLSPCLSTEYLVIHLSHLHGTFQASLLNEEIVSSLSHEEILSLNNLLRDLNGLINHNLSGIDYDKLNVSLYQLRLWLGRRRVLQSLCYLPYYSTCKLGLAECPQDHPAARLVQAVSQVGEETFTPVVFVKLANQADYYLVIELSSQGLKINYSFSVIITTPCVNKSLPMRIAKSMFLKATSLVTVNIDHIQSTNPGSEINDVVKDASSYRQFVANRKRTALKRMLSSLRSGCKDNDEDYSLGKKYRRLSLGGGEVSESYAWQIDRMEFLTAIPKFVAFAQETVTISMLVDQMNKVGIENSGLTLDEARAMVSLQIFRFPAFHHKLVPANTPANASLSGITHSYRIYKQVNQMWSTQLMLSACPMGKLCCHTDSCRNLTQLYTIDRLKASVQPHFRVGVLGDPRSFSSALLQCIDLDWKQMEVLRALLYQIEEELPPGVRILKCSDLQSVVFTYGPNHIYMVKVIYKLLESKFELQFYTNLSATISEKGPPQSNINPHTLMSDHLETILNRTNSLSLFLNAIVETLEFVSIVVKLRDSSMVFHCSHDNPGQMLKLKSLKFSSIYDLRLIYCNIFCIRISLIKRNLKELSNPIFVEIQDDFAYLQFQKLPSLESYLNNSTDIHQNTNNFSDTFIFTIPLEELHRLIYSGTFPSSIDSYLTSSLSLRVLESTLARDSSLLMPQQAPAAPRTPRLQVMHSELPDLCISINSACGKHDFRLSREDNETGKIIWSLKMTSRENKDLETLDKYFNTQVMRDDGTPCASSLISFIRLLTIPHRCLVDMIEYLSRNTFVRLNLCSMVDPLLVNLFQTRVPSYGQPAVFVKDHSVYLQLSIVSKQPHHPVIHVYVSYEFQGKTISHLSLSPVDKTISKLDLVKQYQNYFKTCGKKWDTKKTGSQNHEDSPFQPYFEFVNRTYSSK